MLKEGVVYTILDVRVCCLKKQHCWVVQNHNWANTIVCAGGCSRCFLKQSSQNCVVVLVGKEVRMALRFSTMVIERLFKDFSR